MTNKAAPPGSCPKQFPQSQFENEAGASAVRSRSETKAGFASPEEGAELIRAFVRIRQPDVRAAIIQLAARLST